MNFLTNFIRNNWAHSCSSVGSQNHSILNNDAANGRSSFRRFRWIEAIVNQIRVSEIQKKIEDRSTNFSAFLPSTISKAETRDIVLS